MSTNRISTKSNLLSSKSVMNKYYGNFRGADFSSDPTQVNEQRFAYIKNMFKDYQSSQGQAVETIPGYRRRFIVPDGAPINNIHYYEYRDNQNNVYKKTLIHAGTRLYLWDNYPLSVNVPLEMQKPLSTEKSVLNGLKTFEVNLDSTVASVTSVKLINGQSIVATYNTTNHILTVETSQAEAGDYIYITYYEGVKTIADSIYNGLSDNESKSFIFNNILYIIDGHHYIRYNGTMVSPVSDVAYIPTTYINIIPDGTNANIGTQYEQRNILQPKFVHTYIATGTATDYYLNETNITAVDKVEYYGRVMMIDAHIDHSEWNESPLGSTDGTFTFDYAKENDSYVWKLSGAAVNLADYGVHITDEYSFYRGGAFIRIKVENGFPIMDEANPGYTVSNAEGKITFGEAPEDPESVVMIAGTDMRYEVGYAGIKITASKPITSVSGVTDSVTESLGIITGCTLTCVFDNRVFMSGNPKYPNHIFYCGRNLTSYVDPTYFGILNYVQDGVGSAPITGLMVVSDTLLVLKSDSRQDGCIYYHSGADTNNDIQPRVYPSTQGLAGTGCIGACISFKDDPVFISKLGVEAIGQLSVRLERAVEHRSSLVDAKLVNMNIENAKLEVWNGYLLLLVDGCVFMADSRQTFTHDTGIVQYEWYFLEDIGIYDGQYTEYKYKKVMPDELIGKTVTWQDEDLNEHILPLEIAEHVWNDGIGDYEDLRGLVANAPNEEGNTDVVINTEGIKVQTLFGTEATYGVYYIVRKVLGEYRAFLVDTLGEKIGGIFHAASQLRNIDDNIFFGTDKGIVCSFNFDKRVDGIIPKTAYSYDGRTISCGLATKLDCCAIPHLTKNTVKKSTVIKTKTLNASAAKVKVRTNTKEYHEIDEINSSTFSFDDVDFAELSFNTSDQSLFSVKEKEKKWVEKQYYIFSDEYQKPFALYYIAFRYQVSGRYKEK